jgi:hypothetical protein
MKLEAEFAQDGICHLHHIPDTPMDRVLLSYGVFKPVERQSKLSSHVASKNLTVGDSGTAPALWVERLWFGFRYPGLYIDESIDSVMMSRSLFVGYDNLFFTRPYKGFRECSEEEIMLYFICLRMNIHFIYDIDDLIMDYQTAIRQYKIDMLFDQTDLGTTR